MDKNYWKDAYKHLWSTASAKEEFIKKLIEQESGLKVELSGMGAGSSEYIDGTAKDNKYEKGDADLYIREIDAYIEVTGPNIKMEIQRPLWIRPDKIANTSNKIKKGRGK